MNSKILIVLLSIFYLNLDAQTDSLSEKKERLDFAKTYFEMGGTMLPSFTGKRLINNQISNFENSASVIPYLNWGGFHFWGHAEFYVTIPLAHIPFKKNEENSTTLLHSVATGARLYPWAYQERKVRPYLGLSWSALDFKQKIRSEDEQPNLSKDFMLGLDAGLIYGYRNFSLRVGASYLYDNKWDYPISRTEKAEIKTPNFGFQLGLLYAMDFSKKSGEDNIEKWNQYPKLSTLSEDKAGFGSFFLGIGPSISYSLVKSEYNQDHFPYLKDKLISKNYFDIAAGFHFFNIGLFTAVSFRNPKYETKGFGAEQSIKKTSFALEVNKFLLDYTGFTPYVGINLAYDNLKYSETVDGVTNTLNFDNKFEPGITFGWDIRPGKNQEAIILRTNLRWYPFSTFKVDSKAFNFSQLEYNLIQVVIYPDRMGKKKK